MQGMTDFKEQRMKNRLWDWTKKARKIY